MSKGADYWIRTLNLVQHPEGGFYRQTYRSPHALPGDLYPQSFPGPRPLGTAIYYLLQVSRKSLLHRIKSDELWHFYEGSPLTIYIIEPGGRLIEAKLGRDPDRGESLQVLVRGGCWFGAVLRDSGSYALAGCTVVPGFDFEDFELGVRHELVDEYPHLRHIIELLT